MYFFSCSRTSFVFQLELRYVTQLCSNYYITFGYSIINFIRTSEIPVLLVLLSRTSYYFTSVLSMFCFLFYNFYIYVFTLININLFSKSWMWFWNLMRVLALFSPFKKCSLIYLYCLSCLLVRPCLAFLYFPCFFVDRMLSLSFCTANSIVPVLPCFLCIVCC